MPIGLLDLAPITREVSLGNGQTIAVQGLTIEATISIWQRFPEIRQIFSGKTPPIEELITSAPGAVAAIIASGCGFIEHAQAEEVAAKMPIAVQLDILSVVVRLTMPEGAGPFVESLVDLGLLQRSSPQPTTVPSGEVTGTKSES